MSSRTGGVRAVLAAGQAPQVTAQYPPQNYGVSTLTPQLIAAGTGSGSLQYQFGVYDGTGNRILQSAVQGSAVYQVPSGTLTWGRPYAWAVAAFDGTTWSPLAVSYFSTAVPQPPVTSRLSQNADGRGYDAATGNYTTSATDAQVPVVGPALAITRLYNSADSRVSGAFGAGWSSVLDARATEQKDASGALQTVVVTYPDGPEIAFGRNADGSFAPPLGRYSTLTPVSNPVGYALVDKNGTKYLFVQAAGAGVYTISSITDVSGRAVTFGYIGGQVTTMTSVVSNAATKPMLHLTWSTPAGTSIPHVVSVMTDPATSSDGSTAQTWTYAYAGDKLMAVCPPTSTTACTTYSYTSISLYPSTVADLGPRSYWRLGEAPGATQAVSSVLANEGSDNGTYANVSLGQAPRASGFTPTSAGFSAANKSNVLLRPGLVSIGSYQSISLWFNTSAKDGVLFSYQADSIGNPSTPGNYTPALYVGDDGYLLGKFYTPDMSAPIKSKKAVNDGAWHHVVLTGAGNTQSMYLDGSWVNTISGPIQLYGNGANNVYLGAGFIGGGWPDEPYASSTIATGYPEYFTGQIADASFYDRWLSATEVTALYGAGTTPANVLATLTRPSGNVAASIAYDPVAGRVSQLTDANGGVWKVGVPTVSGSSQLYASTVLGTGPGDYWRLGDASGSIAVNQVHGGTATYNAVTLGASGPFSDATAASLNGSSSYLTLPATDVPAAGPSSVSMWFNVPAGRAIGGVLFGYGRDALTDPNVGDGPFNAPDTIGVWLADLDGDGKADLIRRSTDGNLYAWPNTGQFGTANTFGPMRVIGNGWGSDPNNPKVFFADLDGDGKAELIKETPDGTFTGWPNINGLNFNWGTPRTIADGFGGSTIVGAYFADLDGDHKADLIDWTSDGIVHAWGNITGLSHNWTGVHNIGSGWSDTVNTKLYFADLDGDGRAELIAQGGDGVLTAFPNVAGINGSWGTSRPVGNGWNSPDVAQVLFADLDGDHKADLVKRSTNGNLYWWRNVDGINFSWSGPTQLHGDWTGTGVPALYVGNDGKLRGQFWCNCIDSVTNATSGPVNDGRWHHVVLAAGTGKQTLYLDGQQVGSTMGAPVAFPGAQYVYAGAAVTGDGWPARPSSIIGYFDGSISDVAYFHNELSATQVGQLFAASRSSTGLTPVVSVPVTDPGGKALREDYDPTMGNRLIAATDGLGNTTRYGYDTGGFLNTVTDPNGNVVTTGHDVRGNVVSRTTCQNLAGNECSTAYYTYYPDDTSTNLAPDPRNDVLLTVRDPRSTSATDNAYLTSYAYDATGNRIKVTTAPVDGYPTGRTTVTTYTTGATLAGSPAVPGDGFTTTAAGLPATVTTPGGAVTRLWYDAQGRLLQTTDAVGLVTTYTYDNLGRQVARKVVSDTYPSGLTTTTGYDKLNRPLTRTDPPVANRVTGAVHTPTTSMVYDADGNLTSTSTSDPTGGDATRTTTVTFNNHDQQSSVTDPSGATTRYGYDGYGNRTSVVDAAGTETDSAYDADGHLLTTTLKGFTGDPVSPSPAKDLARESRAYDPAGRLASVTDAMGWVTAYTYTDNGLTASVTRTDPAHGTSFLQESDSYDPAGNVTGRATNDTATATTTTFDTVGRVATRVVDPGGLARRTTYQYGPDDQVLTTTVSDANTTTVTDTTYDPMGRPTSTTVHDSSVTPVGRWQLNDGTGTTALDSDGNQPGTTTGGVSWSGAHNGSATFDGTGAVSTGGPVVDTTRSFTVSAWVYLTDTNDYRVAVDQLGNHLDAFSLGYAHDTNHWQFGRWSDDSTTPATHHGPTPRAHRS